MGAEAHFSNENYPINTLEDALGYFDLDCHVLILEISIEDVRQNKKKKEDHEEVFKEFDKEIQKLSLKYHPDKVRNRGGTEKDITRAQELQTALNATRTVLKILNSTFLEDIDIDHKFRFYMNLTVSCNEKEIKNRVYEVMFKISRLSQIKQKYIIPEIRKFLTESKNCIQNYLNYENAFEKHRDLALLHLKYCIGGFEKLYAELKETMEQCEESKNDKNMHTVLQATTYERKRDLGILKLLEENARSSLKRKYKFFSPDEFMDPYFVLPVVYYTNVIVMCSVMTRQTRFWNSSSESFPNYKESLGDLMRPHYLASYYSGNKLYENVVLGIMCEGTICEETIKQRMRNENIRFKFIELINEINESMEQRFKVEDYNEVLTMNLFVLELQKCKTMMREFGKKQEELSKDIKEFQEEKMKMQDELQELIEATKEQNLKVKESLEQSKVLEARPFGVFSEEIK